MTNEELKDEIAEFNEDALFADGMEDALIGYVEQYGRPPIALYDRNKAIECLMKQGMDHEGAEEYFYFNTVGAWMGDSTPAFAVILRPNDRKED